MEKKVARLHIFVEGGVQGVGFRWWARRCAKKLGLYGWARNLDDGRVEIVAEGNEDKLDDLVKLIKKGPALSKVEDIDVNWKKATGEFDNFKIVKL